MNKPQVVKELAERLDTTQVNAEVFLDGFYEMVSDYFVEGGDSFRLGNLGILKRKTRGPRQIRNIQTKEMMTTEAHDTITFQVSSNLKSDINPPSLDI